MRPIIKFRYGKALCPLCLADHGSRKLYRSVRAIERHLNLDHSYGGVYSYTVFPTPTSRNNYPFTIHGSCGCGCGEPIEYTIPFISSHGPPYYLSGHRARIGPPNKGAFEEGHVPWNTGTKGVCKPNSGSFKKGNIPTNYRGGFYTASNGQVFEWTGEYHPSGTRKYKPRTRRIMEELLGRPLQADEVVIHLDDISSHDVPINLKVISTAENAVRNRQKWLKAKREAKMKELGPGFCSKCQTLMLPRAPCPRCWHEGDDV